LEKEVKNIEGLVTTQAQEKRKTTKRTDKNKKAMNKIISKQEKKVVETCQHTVESYKLQTWKHHSNCYNTFWI